MRTIKPARRRVSDHAWWEPDQWERDVLARAHRLYLSIRREEGEDE